jgi:CHASE3 domain sensor protein
MSFWPAAEVVPWILLLSIILLSLGGAGLVTYWSMLRRKRRYE